MSAANLDAIHVEIMQKLSSERLADIPITAAQLRSGIGMVDTQLDLAEIAIGTAIPVGPIRAWMVANPHVVRRIMELVERKRREVF
jgi:hypothetical protein